MNQQEIYDFVITHLRTQGNPWGSFMDKRSWGLINPLNPCQRCARGCLMTERKLKGQNYYTVVAEDLNFKPNYYSKVGRTITDSEIAMLSTLEDIFENYDPRSWEHAFENLAFAYGLVYKSPALEAVV